MPNVAIYTRISRADHGSTDNQLQPCKDLASSCGTISHIYSEAISAVASDRPQFALMLSDAGLHKFDTLVVWKLDRFGRNILHNLNTIKHLRDNAVNVLSVCESWLDTTPNRPATADLLIAVVSWVAEQERNNIIARTNAGLARAGKKAFPMGDLPAMKSDMANGLGLVATAKKYGVSHSHLRYHLKEKRC